MANIDNGSIAALEKVYGKASPAGFGSAVFHGDVDAAGNLEEQAKKHYISFLGPKWTSESESVWMAPWKKVYERGAGNNADILAELSGITDNNAKVSIPLLTELIENAEEAKLALAGAFNNPTVHALAVFCIGDGEAMSGIILSGLFEGNYGCSVIALMD